MSDFSGYNGMRPGPAMQLSTSITSTSGENLAFSIVTPYYENFSLSSTQTPRQPVKELFELIKDSIVEGASTAYSGFATAVKGAQELSDIFGVKVGGKGYYSLAWKEGSVGEFSTKVLLHRGWAGMWDAKNEVSIPLQKIHAYTVPAENGPFLAAPMPSSGEVVIDVLKDVVTQTGDLFTSFGNNITGEGFLASGARTATAGIGGIIRGAGEVIVGTGQKVFEATRNLIGSGASTWAVKIGYYDGTAFKPYFTLPSCVATQSTSEYAMEMEENGTEFHPIWGSVTITFSTQTIITNQNFNLGSTALSSGIPNG